MVYQIQTRGSSRKHKIRHLKTNTGDNFSITLSKEAALQFSGCQLFETVLTEGILLTSGCPVEVSEGEKSSYWIKQ